MTQQPLNLDPTAGARARQIRKHPGDPQRIADPTDPRYGKLPPNTGHQAGGFSRAEDPTDPRYEEPGA